MKNFFVGNVREIESDGVKFSVDLTEKDCFNFYDKWYF